MNVKFVERTRSAEDHVTPGMEPRTYNTCLFVFSCQALMSVHVWLVALVAALRLNPVSALGTSCTEPLGPGTAAAEAPFWLETIEHRYARICKQIVTS